MYGGKNCAETAFAAVALRTCLNESNGSDVILGIYPAPADIV